MQTCTHFANAHIHPMHTSTPSGARRLLERNKTFSSRVHLGPLPPLPSAPFPGGTQPSCLAAGPARHFGNCHGLHRPSQTTSTTGIAKHHQHQNQRKHHEYKRQHKGNKSSTSSSSDGIEERGTRQGQIQQYSITHLMVMVVVGVVVLCVVIARTTHGVETFSSCVATTKMLPQRCTSI